MENREFYRSCVSHNHHSGHTVCTVDLMWGEEKRAGLRGGVGFVSVTGPVEIPGLPDDGIPGLFHNRSRT